MSQLLQRGLTALEQGQLTQAEQFFKQVLAQNPQDAVALHSLGMTYYKASQWQASLPILEQAARLQPKSPNIWNNLGLLYQKLADAERSIAAFKRAIRLQPDFTQAYYNLGNIYLMRDNFPASMEQYQKCLNIDPHFTDALAYLGWIMEKLNRLEEAQDLTKQALAIELDNIRANLTQGMLDNRSGKHQNTIKRMKRLLKRTLSPVDRSSAIRHMAVSLERLQQHDHAFACYSESNQILKDFYKPLFEEQGFEEQGTLAPQHIDRIKSCLDFSEMRKWANTVNDEWPTPVFILGFPRSGTTLLDCVLSSHNQIVTLEEKYNLHELCVNYYSTETQLRQLGSLTDAQIAAGRSLYWRNVHKSLPEPIDGRIVIDKLPLNTIFIPLILRFFPEAKFIFALRDPRDVCTSCFVQDFGMTKAMYQFLDWQNTISYYKKVMSLGLECRNQLPLNFVDVRYEELIDNLKMAVLPVLQLLDLPWKEDMQSYQSKATKRRINTPSYRQVVKPLYRSSVSRWRRFEKEFKPYQEQLSTICQAFGYETM